MRYKSRKSICFITTLSILFALFSFAGIVVQADETSEAASENDVTEVPSADEGAHSSGAVYISDGARVTDNEYTDSEVVIDNPSNINGTTASGVMLSSCDYSATGIVISDGSYTFGGDDDNYTVYSDPENNYVGTSVLEGTETIGSFNSVLLFDLNDEVDASATTGSSGIDVENIAILNINNVYMQVDGARRYVASNYNTGTMIVNDSYLVSTGNADGNTDNISLPFSNEALLISGAARTNFSIGSSKTYYFNSIVIAEGWAALSTDSATDSGLDLYAYNTNAKALNGGYGTYADTNCRVWLYGSNLNSAEIGGIISKNGQITVADGDSADSGVTQYNTGETTSEGTTVTAGRNAFMLHAPDMMGEGVSAADCGTLSVSNSTLVTSEDLTSTFDYSSYSSDVKAYVDYVSGDDILVKSTSADITLENTLMESYNGVLVHSVINSDSQSNFLEAGDNDSVQPISVAMIDMDVEGNIVHEDYQRNMEVNLDNTILKGDIIQGSYDSWQALWAENGVTTANWLPDSSWTGNNELSLTVSGDSTWTIADQSTLSSLTIEDGAIINAEDGFFVEMTVDGERTDIVPGTYTGDIILTAFSDTLNFSDNIEITDYTDYSITINEETYNYGGLLTMTVDAAETPITTDTFNGNNIVITCTEYIGDIASETKRGDEDYRTGLYIGVDGIRTGKICTFSSE